MSEYVLKDIGAFKNLFLSSIINSHDICSLLLNKEEFSEEEKESLVYERVFPFLYIDDIQTSVESYICFEVTIPRCSGTIKNLQLNVLCCCHKDYMNYKKRDYIGTRVDILSDMVEREIHDSKEFGIGKLDLQSVRYIFPNTKYYARELIFNVSDFKVKRN